jgi:hypothetical protein
MAKYRVKFRVWFYLIVDNNQDYQRLFGSWAFTGDHTGLAINLVPVAS